MHPGAIRVALRAIPDLYAVTDATAAAGMLMAISAPLPTGEKCENGARLVDDRLAGSSLTMIQAFRNLVVIGLTIEEALRRTSGAILE